MPWLVPIAGWRNLKLVKDHVGRQLDCYFPKFREKIIYRGHKITRERFLFGRYFFIDYSIDAWSKAMMLPCIFDFLRTSDFQPALVSDQEMHELRSREYHGYIPVKQKFQRGDRVQVSEGILSGVDGHVEQSGSQMIISANGIHVRIDETKLRPI